MAPRLTGPLSHWSPNRHPRTTHSIAPPPLIAPLPPTLIGISPPPPNSLVPQCNPGYTVLIGPSSHCSPQSNPVYPVLIGSPSHWSPNTTLVIQFSLVPHLIGPPVLPRLPCSHWLPISLVPQCNPGCTVLIGPPSHWSSSLTLFTLFSLVPHLIGPPMRPWLHSSHWSPISLVPQSNPVYPVLIGSPSHWSPNATLVIQFSLVPYLIGPPV